MPTTSIPNWRAPNAARQVAYSEGDVVYKPGDKAQCMYLLVSGRVAICPSRMDSKQLQKMAGTRTVLPGEAAPGPDSDANDSSKVAGDAKEGEEAHGEGALIEQMGTWTAEDGEVFGGSSHHGYGQNSEPKQKGPKGISRWLVRHRYRNLSGLRSFKSLLLISELK